jgi:hypothetical protein
MRPADRLRNSATLFGVVPVGTAFGHWMSKIISLSQLRRLMPAIKEVARRISESGVDLALLVPA